MFRGREGLMEKLVCVCLCERVREICCICACEREQSLTRGEVILSEEKGGKGGI